MRISPAIAYVRSLSQEFYTFTEVAERLGVSVNALRSLAKRHPQTLGPYGLTYLGEVKIYLFRPEDVEFLRRYLQQRAQLHPALDDLAGGRGRPPLWSHAEQRARHARHASAYYWRKRAERLQGDRPAMAAEARRRADHLHAELAAEHAARIVMLSHAADPAVASG